MDGLSTTENVCNDGMFSCSPAPIIFTRYRNSFTGLTYACRTDSRSGSCGGNTISVCVSLPTQRLTYQVESWAASARVYLKSIQLTDIQCRNDGNRLVAPELEGSELELSEEDFSDEDLLEEELFEEFPEGVLDENVAESN